jgi:5-methylcytosine-specific restriction endonuclease McrA
MIAAVCHRHGLHSGRRCARCHAEQEQRRRQRPGHRAHHTARHKRLRARVLKRDGACVDCGGDQDLTLDYIVALDDGGAMDESNAECRCRQCNSRRGRVRSLDAA